MNILIKAILKFCTTNQVFKGLRNSVKPLPFVVDKWSERGSLTERPEDLFAVSWPKQLRE